MSELVAKNIVLPAGGDIFFPDQPIFVKFEDISLPQDQSYFDFFITLDYNGEQESTWDFVSRLPINTEKYEFSLKREVFGNNIRLATCGVSQYGLRSSKNIMAKSFSFVPRVVRDPVLLNPVSNRSYSNAIDLIVDNSYLNAGEKNNVRFYSYFSSPYLSILNSPIAERVDAKISQIKWNISDLPNSNDYEILCYYSDDLGNRSSDVIIKNIKITNPGVFLIDTEPPQTAIKIQNESEYISDPNININLYSYDDTTGVHGFIFKELRQVGSDIESEPTEVKRSEPRDYSNNNYYNVLDEDGRTYVAAFVQDFAGNRTDYSLPYNSSLTYNINYFRSVNLSINSFDITASGSDGVKAFFAVSKGNNHYLMKKTNIFNIVAILDRPCISLKVTNSDVLMSFKNTNSTLEIKRFDGVSIHNMLIGNERNSACVSIEFYKNSYYLGCENGSLLKFNGTTFDRIRDIEYFKKPIRLIENTKNNIMNIYLNLGTEIFAWDGSNMVKSKVLI